MASGRTSRSKQKKGSRGHGCLLTLAAVGLIAALLFLFRNELLHAFRLPRPGTSCNYTEPCCLPELQAERPERILVRTGYTLSYNPVRHTANWVAYELTREELNGKARRIDRFRKDPDLRSESADNGDYRRSGFDKGHLAPAADMSWSREAMQHSFYLSNVAPQHPALNRGKWKELEERIRCWAAEDSVVAVACGPVISPDDSVIGKNRVAVPRLFFKVLLLPFGRPPRAIGFLFANDACDEPLSGYCVSVDSVESLTGIDFFPALPDDEETTLEAACEPELWRWLPNQRGAVSVQYSR